MYYPFSLGNTQFEQEGCIQKLVIVKPQANDHGPPIGEGHGKNKDSKAEADFYFSIVGQGETNKLLKFLFIFLYIIFY